MKIAIVGTRKLKDAEAVYSIIADSIPKNCSEVVSGGAEGVDKLAERYARENHLRLTLFLPDYETYGRNAPRIRNEEMVNYADMVFAFWDMDSNGTAYTISYCIKTQRPVKIFRI